MNPNKEDSSISKTNTNKEDSPTSNQKSKTNTNIITSIQSSIEITAKIFALFATLIYVCGILALNAHFYQYGIVDLGLASSDYLVVGSLFILYIATYAVFGGRSVILGPSWLKNQIDLLNDARPRKINSIVAFTESILNAVFLHCLSAAFFSLYAFGNYESFLFYSVLIIAFIIKYPLDTFGINLKYPFFSLIIDIVIRSVAIWVFFYYAQSMQLIHVFLAFLGFSFYINFVLDGFDRYEINRDRIIFTIVYSVIFFLGSAVYFGAAIYGDMSKKIGGGQNTPIEISASENIIKSLGMEQNKTLHGDAIYISNDNIYIEFENSTYVFPKQSVNWIKFKNNEEKNLTSVVKNILDINKSKL